MVFYDFKVEYIKVDMPTQEISTEHEPEKMRRVYSGRSVRWDRRVAELNDQFGFECGLDGCITAVIASGTEGDIHVAASCKIETVTLKKCKDFICETLDMNEDIEDTRITDVKEISVKDFENMVNRAIKMNFINGRRPFLTRELGLNYFTNSEFHARERCLTKGITYKNARRQADMILGGASLYEELERIYSAENKKKFYGHPVHYKLSVGNVEAAMDIVGILVPALKKNGRILGSRIVHVYDVEEGCYDEPDMENLFEASRGNTVVIELAGTDGVHGNFASAYEPVVNYFDGLVKKFGNDTLCIFIENTEHPGFSQSLIGKVQNTVDIIELKEGYGDYERAVRYFMKLSKKADFTVSESEVRGSLPKQKQYSATEVYGAYQKWQGKGLKSKIYKAYQTVSSVKVAENQSSSEPYKDLQDMVGLTGIKDIVEQIIAAGKTEKMRSEMGMDTYKATMHMIFTGNPGSAKTTVARLIAQILKEEGILDSGRFVECGRADLIAKYVGWTAKEVRRKFLEARGGVLFIDEAYSLVDDTHSFGDEAINTIVQEMENFREDVIVIFAGYPEKMQEFLDKNEGLRSRIAFHLDFPDYTSSEMLDILHLMVKQKGYRTGGGVDDKCLQIFEDVVNRQEFGNGRFARNLLEQAMMKQSQRVIRESKGKKISRKKLTELKTEDFDVNVSQRVREEKQTIGFRG